MEEKSTYKELLEKDRELHTKSKLFKINKAVYKKGILKEILFVQYIYCPQAEVNRLCLDAYNTLTNGNGEKIHFSWEEVAYTSDEERKCFEYFEENK